MKRRSVIITADDLGLWPEVNDAVFAGHEADIISSASIRVSAPAAHNAMVAAANHPRLDVGLHLVLCDGRATLPHRHIPNLVDRGGRLPVTALEAAWLYRQRGGLREELKAEIRAQIEKFLAGGLFLSYISSHFNLHLHPTVVKILSELSSDYPIAALRKPCGSMVRRNARIGVSASESVVARLALRPMVGWGRVRSRRFAGPDRVDPLASERPVTEDGVAERIRCLPNGTTELICHPGSLSPQYDGIGEAAVVTSRTVREAMEESGVRLISYRDITEGRQAA